MQFCHITLKSYMVPQHNFCHQEVNLLFKYRLPKVISIISEEKILTKNIPFLALHPVNILQPAMFN